MIGFLKRLASAVPTPASGKVTLYVDATSGEPSYKDDTGTVHSLQGATGPAGAAGSGVPTGGTAGQVLAKVDGADYNTHWVTPSGGGGSALPSGIARYLAAALEPDAIEPMQKDTFSYAVGSSTTKLLMASWQTRLGSTGRFEVRNPQRPFPLRGVTLNGTGSGSCAVIIDPSIPSYTDAAATYYDRLQKLYELPTRTVSLTGTSQNVPFLPGPYGAIITQVTCFDLAWIIWRYAGTYGPNLWDEISDSSSQRIGDTLALPIAKRIAGEFESSSAGTGSGSVSFVLCPADWSAVPDATVYDFRDDFMAASLDTGVWTRSQSTAGNVEIDTTYQWCKLFGIGSWAGNSMYRTTGTARSSGKTMIVDYFAPRGAYGTGAGRVGWSDGGGHSDSNMAHSLNFAGGGSTGLLNVWESGNNRGTVGSGWTAGCIYRIKITLTATGATYAIQGGPEYPTIGSGSWTDVTPGTSSGSASTLYAAAMAYAGQAYISDVRIV